MSKIHFLFLLSFLLINAFIPTLQSNLQTAPLKTGEIVKEISQDIAGNVDHKKAEFSFPTGTENNLYFKYKYEASTLPSSLITTFRIEFDSYSTQISNYKVICSNVPSDYDDAKIIDVLNKTSEASSACINGFKQNYFYDGFVRLDNQKTILGIMIKESSHDMAFDGRVNLRIKERILGPKELKPNDEETYTLVPFTINIPTFREEGASKILFYSYSRNLQMLYAGTTNYPSKLFEGNILSVYTNPNMVRQKYQNASIMTLLLNPQGYTSKEQLQEDFQFEIKLFPSNYLLDYYVSTNSEGRTLNRPLLINMTECTDPYYVILNYNRPEGSVSLILDQIYGKIKSLAIADTFTKNTWDEMIDNNMNYINIEERKYRLPANSVAHIDVYKIECDLPLMLNFYYTDENDLISKMGYGDINIFTLEPYEIVNVPFFNLRSPEIIIEIFNPFYEPTVIVSAQEENLYQSNTLIKLVPFTLANGITIKERAGVSDTRIIIKAGYSRANWIKTDDPYVLYNSEEDIYAFSFPITASRYNYTYAFLSTSGTNENDNVKYCFTTSIGAALKPSSENCYRVSKDNSYVLKVYNPLNMFKDYYYDESYAYYVTFKTETTATEFNVKSNLMTYDTTNRNFEGINNKVTIANGQAKSILTALPEYQLINFLQIHICDKTNDIRVKIKKPLTEETIVPEKAIGSNTKNNFILYNNILLDTEVEITGKDNTEIFLRYAGMPSESYLPQFNANFKISFDSSTNTITIESPIVDYEFMRYTVIIDSENKIRDNSTYTLCAFINDNIDRMGQYRKSVVSTGPGSIQINFAEFGFKVGQRFDAIVYSEQIMYTKMAFLSDVIQDSVAEISIDTFHEIKDEYPQDNEYVYLSLDGKESDLNYYFSYLPEKIMDVPLGALRIELDESTSGNFHGVYCAFVNNDTDALGRIQELENMIDLGDSFCVGEQSKINSKRYNYIFKYENNKEDNVPKMLVIKLLSEGVKGKFNIYIRKEPGVEVVSTDFNTEQKYGLDENNKKSLIPYIVDLKKIRGEETEATKISKILFYSRNSELQMYYIPEDKIHPVKLFSGNIALAYTKPELAQQKYHATTLVLLSQSLDEDAVDSSFRFHTKMFKSEDQIEFFVSQNPEGRTLNFPLSLEMNVCTENNKKLYYLLNYNQPEPLRTLHLEMVFGYYLRARIAREINAETWDSLISTGMSDIYDYQADLPEKSQHIDVIEIECLSPLLINAYYSYDGYQYQNVKEGEIVVKEISPDEEFKFTIEPQDNDMFYYSLSLYNSIEVPYVTMRFSDGTEHYISGNTLQNGELVDSPSDITIINKANTKTRFIFKVGLNIEHGDWKRDTSVDTNGILYVNENKYIYRFPPGENKKSYTTISFLVNGINTDVENVKFCYSTSLGVAMEASRENCFRTGRYIPYTLTFINPLIVAKNYQTNIDKYYISFRPFENNEHIRLQITENTYESTYRNEESVAKNITLKDKKASTILSLPRYKTNKILVQLRSCTPSTYRLAYELYNAYTQDFIQKGKTDFYNDKVIGITFNTDNTYLESELRLLADENESQDVSAFVKHTPIDNDEIKTQEGYEIITFDDTKNTVIFKKPIINEEFTFTVIVGVKGTLGRLTQCDLAFKDKSSFGIYSKTFISVSSNFIIHFIDFSFIGFEVGEEFDLIVYAEERSNFKLEFLYPLFQGKVGKISGIDAVSEYVDGNKYVTLNFQYNVNSNYLFYDFSRTPTGDVTSLKILTTSAKVTKVSCVFVSKYASNSTMVSSVNNAMLENTNVCLDIGANSETEFNALIKTSFSGENSRLVIQVIYGFGEKIEIKKSNLKEELNTINIKLSGMQFGDFTGIFEFDEKLAPTPYIINLEDIRKKLINGKYVSKLLIYSNTTEMAMHYLSDTSPTPLKLFSGNIMMIYTNPDVIYQKYNNAKIMIMTTNALGNKINTVNVRYYDSDTQMQYYLSNNEEGRVLNNPTAIEMTTCDRPYYYILNYNKLEDGQRKLHLDTIFGEAESVKLATSLNYNSWDQLISNMANLEDEQIILTKGNHHFDILEVKCKLPLLLNLYYVDPNNIKTDGIELGDTVILTLSPGEQKTLNFKPELTGPFAYSFNVYTGYDKNPNIKISFENEESKDMLITESGLYTKDSSRYFKSISIENNDRSSGLSTRIIFKFGYVIESIFTPIGDDGIYQNTKEVGRTINLYGYKYDSTSTRLNYTGVDFEVSTYEDNVKFCYSTNLGTYIIPSITNCFRVGRNNPYTISTRNPLIMYKNYYYGSIKNYYVGFRTMELSQDINIKPKPIKYDTNERNLEGAKNKVTLTGETETVEYSTILTAPSEHNNYIFTHIHVCTEGQGLNYEFYNAYSGVNLGYNGYIMADTSFNYLSVPNSKLDTELKLKAKSGTEVFVKHVGVNTQYQPSNIENIKFSYNSQSQQLKWNQPIQGEEFKYTIYIDKIDNIKNKKYTLCSIVDTTKLGRYSEVLTTKSDSPSITLDFTKPDLIDCKEFDVIVVAEQTGSGKITILSPVFNSKGKSSDDKSGGDGNDDKKSNTGLVVIIVILSVIIIVGGIAAFFIIRKYKSKGMVSQDGKQTSMAMLGNTPNEKLVESQAAVDP